jgi:hypothetical protein
VDQLTIALLMAPDSAAARETLDLIMRSSSSHD